VQSNKRQLALTIYDDHILKCGCTGSNSGAYLFKTSGVIYWYGLYFSSI